MGMNKAQYHARQSALRRALRFHKQRIAEIEVRLGRFSIPLKSGYELRPKHPWPLQLMYPVK